MSKVLDEIFSKESLSGFPIKLTLQPVMTHTCFQKVYIISDPTIFTDCNKAHGHFFFYNLYQQGIDHDAWCKENCVNVPVMTFTCTLSQEMIERQTRKNNIGKRQIDIFPRELSKNYQINIDYEYKPGDFVTEKKIIDVCNMYCYGVIGVLIEP